MERKLACINCKEESIIKSSAPSRHELEDELGRYFFSTCSRCHAENEYHVNEVKANESRISFLVYGVIGLTISGLLGFAILSFGMIGIAILAIPAFAYMRLKAQSEKAVHLFNQSEISRTRIQ